MYQCFFWFVEAIRNWLDFTLDASKLLEWIALSSSFLWLYKLISLDEAAPRLGCCVRSRCLNLNFVLCIRHSWAAILSICVRQFFLFLLLLVSQFYSYFNFHVLRCNRKISIQIEIKKKKIWCDCDCNQGGNLIIWLLQFNGIFRDYLDSHRNRNVIDKSKGSGFWNEMVHKTSDNTMSIHAQRLFIT